jgi:putative endonuclease
MNTPRTLGSQNKPLGDRGERLAAEHLERAGWTILARNFGVGHRGVDLVARRGEVVAFVEVKTRAGLGYGHPLEAITALKRREIQRVAQIWVERHGRDGDVYLRRHRRAHPRRRRAADRARGGCLADVGPPSSVEAARAL